MFCERRTAAALIVYLTLLMASGSQAKESESRNNVSEKQTSEREYRIDFGARGSAFNRFIPHIITGLISFDFARYLRVEVELCTSPYKSLPWYCASMAAGAIFPLIDNRHEKNGIFQMKIPAMVNLGIVSGLIDSLNDCGDENIGWFVVGPSSGMDMTWWISKEIGINVLLKIDLLFRILDIDSKYLARGNMNECSSARDSLGFLEASMAIGIAF